MDYEIQQDCERCDGTGQIAKHIDVIPAHDDYPGIPEKDVVEECVLCRGTGQVLEKYFTGAAELDWIKKKIKKILQKLEIPEE